LRAHHFTIPRTDRFLSRQLTGNHGISQDFERAAARYKVKHGSCPVLVIDINAIADDPALQKMLQGKAKLAADELLYKAVFVTSDGVAPAAMKGESG